jgi:hypothetical protein
VLFTADAYAPDDRRFTVLAGDRLTVFVELHAAIHRQGWVSAVSREVRTIWIADAHRGDGKRYVVRSDEILTALLELESAVAAT